VASVVADLPAWAAALDGKQFLPGLVLPCEGNRQPWTGRRCWTEEKDFPDVAWLRDEIRAGRIKALGEIGPQYLGISPNDRRMEPYWQLAEDLDVPVGIHMGPSAPGAAYESSVAPFKSLAYSMAAGDPLLLEEVLLRHKKLRLFVMHAGWPRLESMLALLHAHPGVYVDVAALQAEFIVPGPAYYRYIQALVESGFGKRIMFGSDFPNRAETGIDAIMRADFLSAEQEADILCHNAARFLRLSAEICSP
jgi:predicted TIM-barrel fold metal-dependent hydrolase